MKKLFILSAIALSGLIYNTANAQLRIHLSLGFAPRVAVVDAPPPPAPAVCDDNATADYDPADDYYYLPDVNAYYNVNDQCYYYNDGDEWVSAAYLPGDYYGYDWRAARHYEVRAPRPFMHNDFYMNRFHGASFNWARFRGPQGGYDRNRQFDNRGGFDPRMANRDNRPFDNHSGFDNRGGFDPRMANRDNRQFDNHGSYGQNFDNGNRDNFQNRGDNRPQQFNPNQGNQNRDNRGFGQPANRGNDQGRFAQTDNRGGYGGHVIANRRMF
jgi:hypothetical protein